jgi:lactose/L-arabinose transport system ATP-binding protein
VTVGLRPQHLTVDPAGATHRVEITEALGGVSYMHVSGPTGEKFVIEQHDDQPSAPGAVVGLKFDGAQAMVFDAADGRRLR